ncbi:methyltransferase domain-containing protein [Sporosarcina sp. FSL K6-3457]|uniref:methyltransferase domain-containing protein n=1 Tax=Sporosarcina sp. FSL K6-3457 TaxID=2978204 RepID=UPI0030FA6C26
MDALKILHRVKEIYEKNENIIGYLKDIEDRKENTIEDILISYDFQAGSYVKGYQNNQEKKEAYCDEIASVLNGLGSMDSILEAGIGEGTTLGPVLNKLHQVPKTIVGFDLSWSRIKYAKEFLNEYGYHDILLTTGDLLEMPVMGNSIDVVYTSHAVEPNGGKEKEILQELYRVARKYVVLFEPAYELATEEARQRMVQHGYVTNLYETALELGYSVVEYKLLYSPINPLNPTGVMVIEKKLDERKSDLENSVICCPLTKTSLVENNSALFTPKGLLAYPIVKGIPCLLPSNAIIATKFLEE